MGRYDASLKILFRQWGSAVLQQLTGETPVAWHNIELHEIVTKYADLLMRTASGRLWHLELQSFNDVAMAIRMLEYALRVFRIFGQYPEQCVLYVGREPMTMQAEIQTSALQFRYRLIDVRELDGERLLASNNVGDNILAILTNLRSSRDAVQRILDAIAGLEHPRRTVALRVLLVLASLRELEETVEKVAKMMPVFDDILENKVLGREFRRGMEKGEEEGLRKGQIAIIRRMIAKKFGSTPRSLDEHLTTLSPAELEDLADRIIDATSPEELLL